jgi:hypothetical protein
MGQTTGNLELEYPDLRGKDVPWADSYEANLAKIDTKVTAAQEDISNIEGAGYITAVQTDGVTTVGDGVTIHIARAMPRFESISTEQEFQLTAVMPREIVLEGNGDCGICSLPDARTLRGKGDRFSITNAMSETAIIKNSGAASSLMVWLMSGETLDVMCTNIDSAAGAWHPVIQPGLLKQRWFDDFYEAAGAAASGSWRPYADTGAAGFSSTITTNLAGRSGVASMNTGTSSSTAWALSRLASMVDLGSNSVMIAASVFQSTIATEAEDFKFEFGLMTKTNGDDETDGVWLDVPSIGAGATPVWRGNSATTAGGVSTPVDSTVVINTNWNTPRLVVSSTGARVDYWINKTYIGKIEGNAPLAQTGMTPMFRVKKSNGTTVRSVFVDWFEIGYARDVR